MSFYFLNQLCEKITTTFTDCFCVKIEEVKNVSADLKDGNINTQAYRAAGIILKLKPSGERDSFFFFAFILSGLKVSESAE